MRRTNLIIVLALTGLVVFSTASMSVPHITMPKMPVQMQTQDVQAVQETPGVKESSETASSGEIFTLSLSGNVYVDKIPVQGAEVSVYVNGKYKGKTVAGDLYMFKVPGVKIGDNIKVVGRYQGMEGSAEETVKFKNMYLDVKIKSGQSFIRRALSIIPTEEDIKKAEEQKKQAELQQQEQKAEQLPASQTASNSKTITTEADAEQLSKQVNDMTWNTIARSFSNALSPAISNTV